MDKKQSTTPRDILYSIFGEKVGVLPISGGWGRTKELATVIHAEYTNEGLSIENTFIKYCTYVELITKHSNPDDKLFGIEFIDKKQLLMKSQDGKKYDKIEITIKALKKKDFDIFEKEWENNINDNQFDTEAYIKKRESIMIYKKRVFWFEISSFFNNKS